MKENRQETESIAEQAAMWLARIDHDQSARAEFVRWLRKSPQHVREMLAITSLDLALRTYDPDRKIDLDTLISKAGTNVVPLVQYTDRDTAIIAERPGRSNNARNIRTGWRWVVGVSAISCLAATLAVGWWHFTRGHEPEQQSDVATSKQPSGAIPNNSATDLRRFIENLEEPQQLPNVAIDRQHAGALSDSSTNELTRPNDRSDVPSQRYYAPVREVQSTASSDNLRGIFKGLVNSLPIQDLYRTEIGEQRTVPTPDGSSIHLNTDSTVKIRFSRETRDIYLLNGQAIFEVAHDANWPFRVHVNSSVVQAIGTKFDVRRLENQTLVTVIEGVVQIVDVTTNLDPVSLSGLPESTKIPAGESVTLTADGRMTSPITVDTKEAAAWRARRLVFHNHTLAQIATEFNRYNKSPKIRVEGDSLQARRYSGVFDANDPEMFLQYLAVDTRLAFDRSSGNLIVLRLRSSYALSPSDQ